MKRFIVLLLLCSSLNTSAQVGIHFEQNLTWKEIKDKAKAENKYIFVDCFATWCGPCKVMDKEVYSLKEVGDYYNSHFISVKVQMDKTLNDDTLVKSWYGIAASLESFFSVSAYPTFLFFSPNGNPAHKVTASANALRFIELGKDAQDSTKQYYNVLKNFQPGRMDTGELKGLALSLLYSDALLAGKIATDYLNRIPPNEISKPHNFDFIRKFKNDSTVAEIIVSHLNKLNSKSLNTKASKDLLVVFSKNVHAQILAKEIIRKQVEKNLYTADMLAFIRTFTNSSTDRGFSVFYNHSDEVDLVMNKKGYAESAVDYVITREEITPLFVAADKGGETPNFDAMWSAVEKKYTAEYARRNIIKGKVRWFDYITKTTKMGWTEYLKALIEQTEIYPPDTSSTFADQLGINNVCWSIFLHSDDKEQLEKAIKWMGEAVRRNPKETTIIDTYASLLYKSGYTNKAIEWEEKAISLSTDKNMLVYYNAQLKKMRSGKSIRPGEN